jgi:hypothetical protein
VKTYQNGCASNGNFLGSATAGKSGKKQGSNSFAKISKFLFSEIIRSPLVDEARIT